MLYRLAAQNLTVPITVVLDNALPTLPPRAGHREALEHRTAVSPDVFTAVQSNRTLLEVGEEKLLEYPLLPHLSGLQKVHSPLHQNRAYREKRSTEITPHFQLSILLRSLKLKLG